MWNTLFPNHANRLERITKRFASWTPTLKPELPDLNARVADAVFWRRCVGARAVPPREFERALCDAGDPLKSDLWVSMAFEMHPKLWAEIGQENAQPARTWEAIERALRAACWDAIVKPLNALPYGLGHGASLWDSLFYACGFTAMGDAANADRFTPLLDLWHAKNFPTIFDRDDRLLVLVAN